MKPLIIDAKNSETAKGAARENIIAKIEPPTVKSREADEATSLHSRVVIHTWPPKTLMSGMADTTLSKPLVAPGRAGNTNGSQFKNTATDQLQQ